MSELDAYKTIGIHPIDCNCISCKPDRYEMPSMPTAPQPEVLPRRGPNAIMEELARRGLRDTAPQPPNEQPVQTLARLLEEAGAVPVVAGIPLNTTLEERIALLLERIAALEAQLAEAQARLAMAVEALRDAQKWATRWAQTTEHRDPNANDYGPYNQHPRGYAICPIPDWEVKQKRDDYAYALAATAETVAQHTAEVERRGAAQIRKQFIAILEWCVKRVRTAAQDEDYDIAADDVINKLVWFADWTRTATRADELEGK